MATRIYLRDGTVNVIAEPVIDPDATPDDDAAVLKRVVKNIMKDILLMTNPQIRAAFAAAKRQVD
jgi:hypothetical protein